MVEKSRQTRYFLERDKPFSRGGLVDQKNLVLGPADFIKMSKKDRENIRRMASIVEVAVGSFVSRKPKEKKSLAEMKAELGLP